VLIEALRELAKAAITYRSNPPCIHINRPPTLYFAKLFYSRDKYSDNKRQLPSVVLFELKFEPTPACCFLGIVIQKYFFNGFFASESSIICKLLFETATSLHAENMALADVLKTK
jgi:hypothetical protein